MNPEKENGDTAVDQSDCVPAAEPGDDTGRGPVDHVLSPALSPGEMTWGEKHAELLRIIETMRQVHRTQLLLAAEGLEIAINHPGAPGLDKLVAKIRESAK